MRFPVAFLLCLLTLPAWANQLKSVRIWPSPDSTRVVLDMASAPDFNVTTMTGPDRLVIDIKSTSNRADLAHIENKSKLVRKLRESAALDKGALRLVMDLNASIKPIVFPLAPAGPYGHRLVIDLPYEDKGSQVAAKPVSSGSMPDIVVAVDPGHGGDDPGAIGQNGHYEKRVTLGIAQKLSAMIDKEPGMRSVMTRTGDYFVDLNRRSELARRSKAELLISIHADSVGHGSPRGASVWVLSTKRANNEMGRWLEQHEKQSDLLGGVGKVISETDSNPYLTRTFLDLSMDKSRAEGYEVSRQVLRQLRQVAILHKKTPQHASLAVLKSPDIPSLLVETGFISNVQEERLLTSSDYQEKIARAIFLGIRAYFHQHPTKGPQLARRNGGGSATASVSSSTAPASSQNVVASRSSSGSGVGVIRPYSEVMHSTSTVSRASSDNDGGSAMATTRHVVKRGESLSKLAERYGVSQNTLVQLNNLRSREIQVGQVIKVPAGRDQEVAVSKAPVRHQVKRGESLSKLAERYGVSQARLADYNNLRSREIQIGQVLKIPQE